MKIVIDIPDEEYERIQALDWKNGSRWYSPVSIAIHNGTPLPKGHGDLIDINNINKITLEDSWHYVISHEKGDKTEWYIDAPTIIEADKEG